MMNMNANTKKGSDIIDQQKTSRLTNQSWFIILALIVLWPIGLFLIIRHRPDWFNKAGCAALILVWVFCATYALIFAPQYDKAEEAYSNQQASWQKIVDEESSRDYWIDLDQLTDNNVVTVACNLAVSSQGDGDYSGQGDILTCTNNKVAISGGYSDYSGVATLKASIGELTLDGDRYKVDVDLNELSIGRKDWEKDSIDPNQLSNDDAPRQLFLTIYNNKLKSDVARRQLTIRTVLTDSDITLLQQYHDKYQNCQAEIAAKKAAEEQARQAAAEQQRAEAEARQAAERQQATQQNAQVQSPSNNNYSPNSGVTTVVSGYCNDGTYVTGNPSARGRANACYGHGGWRDY